MRLIKTFGLAAVAALAAMAFVGATSASATSTQLCNTHSALTCGSAATSVSMTNSTVGTLLSSLVNVLCLTISGSGTPLALANPQSVHITALSFTNCGTKTAHNNCDVDILALPLANLLKTGLDSGTITGTNGAIYVECDNIDLPFLDDINCTFDTTGLTFTVGAQHLTADDTQIDTLFGSLCPDESFLDGLMVTTANRYILA